MFSHIKESGKQLFLHFASDFMAGNFLGSFSRYVCWYCEAVLCKRQLIHGNIVKT